jgi:ESS family glutamate:Na+ symporter
MTISAWWLVAAAVPVLMLGERLVRLMPFLARFSIPVPVVGGLVVAVVLLCLNASGAGLDVQTKVDAPWWTWVVMAEPEWKRGAAQAVHFPFIVAFFTCMGLNASWTMARQGGWRLVLFLGLAIVLGLLQNIVGVLIARPMGASPLLGLLCGGVTLMGGIATAMGFAPEFERHGFHAAGPVGVGAATFGMVVGALIGGPIATRLIRKYHLRAEPGGDEISGPGFPIVERAEEGVATVTAVVVEKVEEVEASGFVAEVRTLLGLGRTLVVHALVLLVCFKVGAWVHYGLKLAFPSLTLPIYMGSLLVGVVLRNLSDLSGRKFVETDVVDLVASVFLGLYLAIAMTSLNLLVLATMAGPMLVILVAQIVLMVVFTYFVVFRLMGKDFDAAMMSCGMVGFGLGATPNAVASMEAVAVHHGRSHRAFLIVTIVGAFLIDFANVLIITGFLNYL